jgi:membrane-associated phospholipid phosphatase
VKHNARASLFCAVLVSALVSAENAAAQPSTLQWQPNWPRFSAVETGVTALLTAQMISVLLWYPDPKDNWDGGILFDDAVRSSLRATTRAGRSRAALVSDVLYVALAAYPTLIDSVLVADQVHRQPDVALQTFAMNMEAYAVAGAVSLTVSRVGRARPLKSRCDQDPNYSPKCGNEANLNSSFISGHTTLAFTSAGLMCAHHQYLPLYGGGTPDLIACLTGVAAASTVGVTRMISDNHYASDVLLGMGLGWFAGYVLPVLLHYRPHRQSQSTSLLPTFRNSTLGVPMQMVLAPQLSPMGAGFTFAGSF